MQTSVTRPGNQNQSMTQRTFRNSNRKDLMPVSKRQVKDMIRSLQEREEVKYSSFSLVPANVDYVGDIISLTDIDQGVTDSTRVGDSVMLKSLEFNFWAITGSANSIMRVITFVWKDLTPPTIGDVLLSTGSSAVAPLSPLSTDEDLARRILSDDLFFLNPADLTNHVGRINVKLNLKVQFEGGTTDGRNKVYVLLISSASANYPTLGYWSKLEYSDA